MVNIILGLDRIDMEMYRNMMVMTGNDLMVANMMVVNKNKTQHKLLLLKLKLAAHPRANFKGIYL